MREEKKRIYIYIKAFIINKKNETSDTEITPKKIYGAVITSCKLI